MYVREKENADERESESERQGVDCEGFRLVRERVRIQ